MQFDAVMVLGKELRRDPRRGRAELRARAAAAAHAWHKGVPRVVALEARLRGQDQPGSAMVAQDLRSLGVPDQDMVLDTCTHSTREEAMAAAGLCDAQSWEHLLVITAGYHLRRARRCFEEALGASRVMVVSPESRLTEAEGEIRAAILEGRPQAQTLRTEARSEAVLSTLEALVSPLPARWRWRLEVRAGTWLRGVS